jgi:hypothetical protein
MTLLEGFSRSLSIFEGVGPNSEPVLRANEMASVRGVARRLLVQLPHNHHLDSSTLPCVPRLCVGTRELPQDHLIDAASLLQPARDHEVLPA